MTLFSPAGWGYNAALHTKVFEAFGMSEPVRLIKKYPNRRLYDTKTSAYITLSVVKELVLKYEGLRCLMPKPEKT